MKEMAIHGSLHNFKPYQDGGGTVSVMLDELQWAEFMAWAPTLHVTVALARIDVEVAESGEG